MKRILILTMILILSCCLAAPAFAAEIDATVYIGEDGGTLNLREGPGMGYEIIDYVDHGDELVILSYAPDWAYVRVGEDQYGYIASKYLRYTLDGLVPEFPLTAVDASPALPADITQDGCYASDLDGDGYTETVTVFTLEDEYGGVVCLRIESVEKDPVDVITEIHSRTRIQIADLDGGDGGLEILISGDVMSDDYVTVCLRWRAGKAEYLPFLSDGEEVTVMDGGASAAVNGALTVDRSLDLFGTWWSYRDYIYEDGKLVPAPYSIWTTGEAESLLAFAGLTALQNIPVRYGDGTVDVLTPGTVLVISGTDGEGTAYFTTADGRTGSIEYTESDEWGHEVSGVHEDELFSGMQYAD